MRSRRVVYAPDAVDHLAAFHAFQVRQNDAATADKALTRVVDAIERLGRVPERGRKRSEIVPGLHSIGIGERHNVVYVVEEETVTVVAFLAYGRDIDTWVAERFRRRGGGAL